jgi:hypothetical protein
MPASSTAFGSVPRNVLTASEQQMSEECMPGWIAFSVAATPPTGMVPGADPDGQASAMTAPALIVGTRMSSVICRSTAAKFSISSGPWGRIFRR